ncbi:MAG: HSP90 family protein [Micromonosporaceae bacterium]
MDKAFQVDLRGVVDLLSHHLYSSPRVYVRELLQNAVDAITARRDADPEAPARALIEPPEVTGDGTLRIIDTGIGLTEEEVHVLLATIGRSSKRDDFGFARHEFLGQFGIGLLSCFLVADEVRVVTRSAREPDAPTVEWRGYADGRYRVALAETPRDEPGTTVTLQARPGCDQWLTGPTVTKLAELYGSLLPINVTVASTPAPTSGTASSSGTASAGGRRVTIPAPPWLATYRDPEARREALTAYAREVFGVAPFDIVDLHVPEAGLTGVAFILPVAANPASRGTHRIYLKRMLLAEGAEGLLPEWAFFARCIVDSDELRPTASREALYEDDLLDSTREALGERLRDWLMDLATTSPPRMREFLRVHQLGVKALSLYDLGMLRLVYRWLPFETSAGSMTLTEFRRQHPTIRYTQTVDEFRQLSAVAAAQGVGLVNGGYTYDSEILSRLPELDPEIAVSVLDPTDLATHFDLLDPETELALRPFLAAAGARLDRLGCDVTIRAYDPPSLPALYLLDREAAHQAELRSTREVADELWSDVLSAFDTDAAPVRPQLVLNHRNPLVRRISALADKSLGGLSVEALYGQALLLGHHPLRAADTALLNRSFLGLLDWAVHDTDAAPDPGTGRRPIRPDAKETDQ